MTQLVTVELVNTTCWCGVAFAIPKALHDEATRKKTDVYCPTGHIFVYGNTDIERLQKEVRQRTSHEDAAS